MTAPTATVTMTALEAAALRKGHEAGLNYPVERLNQAAHILHHGDAVWPDCPWCPGDAA